MNKTVSLRELVGTKIVYAVFLVSYYWMWARTDWKDWYETAQQVLGWFLFAFFALQFVRVLKYKKEGVDEMAERNLRRCDSICRKLFAAAIVVLAWGCALVGHVRDVQAGMIGWVIVLTLLALSVVRTVLFVVLDSKGD